MQEIKQTTVADDSSRLQQRVLQNFRLIWLDTNFDEADNDFKKSVQRLRHVVASIKTFKDVDHCIDFLSRIQTEKVFMIVSGGLGQHIVPEIQTWPQLDSIYVFCGNQSIHETWAKKIPKVRGVYTDIERVCEALQIDGERCDRDSISISFRGIDPLFMYTQLFKEIFLDIDDKKDTVAIAELAKYCRLQDNIADIDVERFEREYRQHNPIWWYTGPFFIHTILNRGLRLLDTDILLKLGFFIRHLHKHIEYLHRQQRASTSPFTVYRGQCLSIQDFEKMKQAIGGLMSFNNFLSTSRNRNLSLNNFARQALGDPNSVGILFVMKIDPKLCITSSIPFVDVQQHGYYRGEEKEILFSTHTIFRIDQITSINDNHSNQLWQVNLTLTSSEQHDLNTLVSHMRQELNSAATGWSRLGYILIKVGEFEKAKQLYLLLLKESTTDNDRAYYNHQLGTICMDMGQYSKALSFYKKSLNIHKNHVDECHPDLVHSYNNIGGVYYKMGEYSKALISHERALSIRQKTLPPNDPDLAASHNNIGLVYFDMGEYVKALSSHEQALRIRQSSLPENHPHLASSYNNIGLVHQKLGEYSKAIASHEKSLHIKEKTLPPYHPDLAQSHTNLGEVYYNMGEYAKALSSHGKALNIRQKSLPPNHPDLAQSHSGLGLVYNKIGEYSKALQSHENALDVKEKTLPPNHPDLAQSHTNLGEVYYTLGDYGKALLSHEKALGIRQKSLPPNHIDLAQSYNGIGLVYHKMGEFSKALQSHEKALQIKEETLPPNHPDLAQSYNSIGGVYNIMGEYEKALSWHEKALDIRQNILPFNHVDLASSYGNIGNVYKSMRDYSKALSFYERALTIWEKTLASTHPHIVLVKKNINFVKTNL